MGSPQTFTAINFTGDMDIWIEDTGENRKKLKAFVEYGMGDIELLEKMKFVPGWTDFHLNNGLRLDIITNMKGLEDYSFDECYNIAAIAEIEDVQVPFLHINHLILNKKNIGREKDQLDVIYLERIKKIEGRRVEQKIIFLLEPANDKLFLFKL